MRSSRRIVTMVDEDGVSRVVSAGPALAGRETGGGGRIEEAWHTATLGPEAFEEDQPENRVPDFSPVAGGSSCRIVHFPPDELRWSGRSAKGDVARAIGADRPAHWIERHPGMHMTRSLDYAVLLAGRLTMVMEEGEVDLKPGDVIVQQAAAHAWKNTGNETAVLFVVMLGLQDRAADNQEKPHNG